MSNDGPMIPGIHYLVDRDVALLAESHAERFDLDADPARGAYSREMADALRAELVRRRLARSFDADPCAFVWFGRLAEE